MLGLEGVAGALAVGVTGDAGQRAVEEVAAVELDARLVGPGGQPAAATPTADAAARIRMPAPVLRGGFLVRQMFIFPSFVRMEASLRWVMPSRVLLADLDGAPWPTSMRIP